MSEYLSEQMKTDPDAVTRDFDAEARERLAKKTASTFRLGGETFTIRRKVRPEAFTAYTNMDENDPDASKSLSVIDDMLLAIIVPGDQQKYIEVREYNGDDEDRVVGLEDLMDVVLWCVEEVTGRPPTQPSSSSALPDATTTT